MQLFIGTYTGGSSAGIYSCRLDAGDGRLHGLQVAARCNNPSFLVLDAARGRLFAVNEQAAGQVAAFNLDRDAGTVTPLNESATHGGAPCHLALDVTGRFLLVANYMGGNVAAIPIAADGRLGEAGAVVAHSGSGPHPRQDAPHPHAVVVDAAHDRIFVPDLGLDQIVRYRLDPQQGTLRREGTTAARPGAGPRHMAFHPTGRWAYVVNELDSTVTGYAYDAGQGTLAALQTLPLLPDDYAGANIAADIHLTPDGRFLYASNRGHDSIAGFGVDGQSGRLTPLGQTASGGRTPRGFAIDPTGRFLLAANQDSDSIVPFRIDPESGRLRPTGQRLDVPRPVCVKFPIP